MSQNGSYNKTLVGLLVTFLCIGGGLWAYSSFGTDQSKGNSKIEEPSSKAAAGEQEASKNKIAEKEGENHVAAPNTKPSHNENKSKANVTPIEQITTDMTDKTLTIMGKIIEVSEGKGHVFFTVQSLDSNATIKGVLFASEVQKNPARVQLIRDVHESKEVVHVTGKIDVYQGELEIKTQKVFVE